MKLKTTEDYLLLIDEKAKIKPDDYISHDTTKGVVIANDEWNYEGETDDYWNKVIAYYPLTEEAKELDLPLLPPFKEDIERLAESFYREFPNNLKDEPNWTYNRDIHVHKKRKAFIEGYKAAQSRQFSLEDMKKAWEFGVLYTKGSIGQAQNYTFDKVIQSLSTRKLPVSFEPHYIKNFIRYDESVASYKRDGFLADSEELKIITNSEGKQVLVGNYIW